MPAASGNTHTFPQLSSSGCACSNSRTWVKGKWPRLPLHSPSHWPFTLILVTFTMSPTCAMAKLKQSFRQSNPSTHGVTAVRGKVWPGKLVLDIITFVKWCEYNCINTNLLVRVGLEMGQFMDYSLDLNFSCAVCFWAVWNLALTVFTKLHHCCNVFMCICFR